MGLQLMAMRKPLCEKCISMKDLPEHYLGRPGEECVMCCSRIYPDLKAMEEKQRKQFAVYTEGEGK